MKYLLILIWIPFLTYPAYGQDMRAASRKAKADYETAMAEAKDSKERIFKDRISLEKEIARMEAHEKKLNSDIEVMQNEFKKLREKQIKLSEQQSDDEMGMRELAGTVLVVARDLETIFRQSQFTACFSERLDLLKPILDKDRFPGIDDFRTISDLFF